MHFLFVLSQKGLYSFTSIQYAHRPSPKSGVTLGQLETHSYVFGFQMLFSLPVA